MGVYATRLCLVRGLLLMLLMSSAWLGNGSFAAAVETPALPYRGLCAHRGASSTHPEDTIASFKEAIRLGAHMIELDVWGSKDGALVIMHDDTVDRTTNGTGKVADLTLEQIKALDAGSKMGAQFAGEEVPTLAEALSVMPRNIWLNVHLKAGPDVAVAAAKEIAASGRLHQAFLACDGACAAAARKAVPGILICCMDRQNGSQEYVDATIAMKADFIQLSGPVGDSIAPLTKQLKEAHIRINFFEPKTMDECRKLFELGVEFPLVNDVAGMMAVAKEAGIEPAVPEFAQ